MSSDQFAGVVLNEVGDVVLTDPEMMLALADEQRLALLSRLQRNPASTAELAIAVGTTDSVVEEQLRQLADVGLVSGSSDRWQAPGRGVYLEIPDEPTAQQAARQLNGVMFLSNDDVPRRWVVETEPRLEPEWLRAAGLFNARIILTPHELRDVQAELERLLAPYTNRPDSPTDGRPVRILSYFLPEAGH